MNPTRQRLALRAAPFAAAIALASAFAAPASAQAMPDPDVMEVAKTPLRDLNIDAQDIPPVLLTAAQNPYATDGLGKCNAIVSAIADLDSVLGGDYDIATDDGSDRFSEGRIAQKMVGSLLPFRGIVREVTGAASNDRAMRAAYTAGMVRRSFLKGWGLGRGCAYPARPKVAEASGSR